MVHTIFACLYYELVKTKQFQSSPQTSAGYLQNNFVFKIFQDFKKPSIGVLKNS